jgi:hypothetical protein
VHSPENGTDNTLTYLTGKEHQRSAFFASQKAADSVLTCLTGTEVHDVE